MPKNKSDREKTIKSQILEMEADFWKIDAVETLANYTNRAIIPDGLILDDFRDYFENFIEEISLDPKYYYSPTWFAEDYYGSADLDFLVLYFAKIPTLFDFNTTTINVISKSALTDLNKLMVQYRSMITDSRTNPKDYQEIDPIISRVGNIFE
jgi:hypothetical protein